MHTNKVEQFTIHSDSSELASSTSGSESVNQQAMADSMVAAAASSWQVPAAAAADAATIAKKMCCNKRIRLHRSRDSGAVNLLRYGRFCGP